MREEMLSSQCNLFALPREICYLNSASMGLLPCASIEAGQAAAARKGQPWLLEPGFMHRQLERARKAAARLLNVSPANIALIPSVSYGVAVAGKNLDIPKGARVLVLKDDHASPVLEWIARAPQQSFIVETVEAPDGDWTASLLEAIGRPSAPPARLASISTVHWADGSAIELAPVAAALRAQGGALLLDATQSLGILSLDVASLDPDFVVFHNYKWLLGPYGRGFLYVAERWKNGAPLEQSAYGRKNIESEKPLYFADTSYRGDASRFDMGGRDFLITLEMASIGMEMIAAWGPPAIGERLEHLRAYLVEHLRNFAEFEVAQAKCQAPHIVSLRFKNGIPAGLIAGMAQQGVHVSQRLGKLRVSPHIYNDEIDMDRFLAALASLLK
jgi:selenocysteine lyase/cysteine desulfurase